MVILKILNSRAQAVLCKSILESKDIWSHIIADEQSGRAKLMVQPEDLDTAQSLLQEMEMQTLHS